MTRRRPSPLRFLKPTSVGGQAILVLVAGLTISHLLSMLIYAGERIDALAILGGRDMAVRAANIAHLLSDTPSDWRPRLVGTLTEPGFRVVLSPDSPLPQTDGDDWRMESVRAFVAGRYSDRTPPEIRVALTSTMEPESPTGSFLHWLPTHLWHDIQGMPDAAMLQISVRLEDGVWVSFLGATQSSPPFLSRANLISTLAMVISVLAIAIVFVTRLTRPLRTLAQAARRIGRDVNSPPMPEQGQDEIRDAIRAFNDMQRRLRQMVDNRGHMLAAISHDLRTPLTLLRLRTELLDPSDDRDRMLATLDEMESMIASILSFSREEAATEDSRRVDLAALLDSLGDDLASATGKSVDCRGTEAPLFYDCRPLGLKRALSNVIHNALQYGDRASVTLARSDSTVTIRIEDCGPGIPETLLEQVFDPFFRVDTSRNRDTGGTGLGLSVARTIINAHGGQISLANRQTGANCKAGGLCVTVTLPL